MRKFVLVSIPLSEVVRRESEESPEHQRVIVFASDYFGLEMIFSSKK